MRPSEYLRDLRETWSQETKEGGAQKAKPLLIIKIGESAQ